MDFSKVRVLLTDGGSRQALTILRGLKKAGCHVTVLCPTRLDVCCASRFADEKIVDPNAAGSVDGFEAFLLEQLKTGKYDVLLPVAEITTDKVTRNEEEYGRYARLACAPRRAYIQAFDKQRTFEKAMEIGIPCPYTRRLGQSVEDFIANAHFPVIIKPRQGLGSIGFHKFVTKEELEAALQAKRFDPDEYVMQEFVSFDRRISFNGVTDQNGNAVTAYACEVLRWYPIDAGTAVAIRTVDAPDYIDGATRLLSALGWQGFANVGFMVDNVTGEPRLLEINGRIPASVKMSWLCGFNVAQQLVELAYGEKVTAYPVNGKFGIMTRHLHADVPWFIRSPKRFSAKPSWFSWKNAYDVVFWRDDPKPFFSYTLQMFVTAKKKINKRKHDV